MKTCFKCHEYKPEFEFFQKEFSSPEGMCKNCRQRGHKRDKYHVSSDRNYFAHIKALYKMDEWEYMQRLKAQGGVCAVCGEAPYRRLNVDHEHRTGAVRGLLCTSCNVLVAHIENDHKVRVTEKMKLAMAYIGQPVL